MNGACFVVFAWARLKKAFGASATLSILLKKKQFECF